MKDKDTRKSKGVAFILFLDKDSAQNCTRAINNKQVSHSFPTRFLIQKPLLIQAKNVGIQWMIKSWISIDFEGIYLTEKRSKLYWFPKHWQNIRNKNLFYRMLFVIPD